MRKRERERERRERERERERKIERAWNGNSYGHIGIEKE